MPRPLALLLALLLAGCAATPTPEPPSWPVLPFIISYDTAVYLPHVSQRVANPYIRPSLRPSTADQLADALLVPDAIVRPAPGLYRSRQLLNVASGVTLDGQGRMTITGHCLMIRGSTRVLVTDIAVTDCEQDGVSIQRAGHVVVEHSTIYGPMGDGHLDVIRSPGGIIKLRHVTIRDGAKCVLLGHQEEPGDHQLTVIIEDSRFIRCRDRNPKVHRATVHLRRVTIADWAEDAIDAQMGALVTLRDIAWIPGHKSRWELRWITSTGAIVREE